MAWATVSATAASYATVTPTFTLSVATLAGYGPTFTTPSSYSTTFSRPTTGQYLQPMRAADAGDGSVWFAYVVNDEGPCYVNDTVPIVVSDKTAVRG